MPGMNGTGPSGQGAMTGGGFGRCNPNADSGQRIGRGMGRGFGGRGRGAGRWAQDYNSYDSPYPQETSKKEEVEFLKNEALSLKHELEDIQKKIKELED